MRMRPEADLSHTTRAETWRRHTGRAQRVPGTFPLDNAAHWRDNRRKP